MLFRSVEDDKPVARMYERGLTKAGMKVVVAYNGQEGLDRLGKTLLI